MIAIIVANVPEGLLPTVTVILTITAKKMAKKFCLVKNLEGVETLGSTSTICSDKTGTLTQNRMTVSHLWCDGDITVADISDDQILSREHLESGSYQRLMRCVTLCNRAAFKPDQEHLPILQRETIADASESALFKYTEIVYGNCQDYREVNTKVCEVPFNSINKYQLSIHVKAAPISHGTAGSLFMVMKGAPEQIIERCSVMYAKGSEQPLDDHWKENFSIAYNALGGMGERVLGFADKNLDPKKFDQTFKFETEPEPNFPTTDLRFLGLVTLIDPARPSVPDAVAKCQAAGVRVIMVTGDHPITAGAIARSVGIITPGDIDICKCP
jgi:sodium/potassium-transporting ATPase subunit alpha